MQFPKTVFAIGRNENSISLGITIPQIIRKLYEVKRGDIIILRVWHNGIETSFPCKTSYKEKGRVRIPHDVVKMLELKEGQVYIFDFVKNYRDGKDGR